FAGNSTPGRNLQSRGESIGQELMGERVGLPRRRFVPGGNSRDVSALVGIGVQNLRKDHHLPLRPSRIHFRLESAAVGLWHHRIGGAVNHQQRRLALPFSAGSAVFRSPLIETAAARSPPSRASSRTLPPTKQTPPAARRSSIKLRVFACAIIVSNAALTRRRCSTASARNGLAKAAASPKSAGRVPAPYMSATK